MYDSIVIGGGHAGVEAAMALLKNGFNVCLITLDIKKIAMMPCNPAIGGPAKGIITREIDALGGFQGYLSDLSTIQIKMLNTSKGPAVRALRAQVDKDLYSSKALDELQKFSNLKIVEGNVLKVSKTDYALSIDYSNNEKIRKIYGKTIIVTTGTYMDSSILIGETEKKEGPNKQKTTSDFSKSLQKIGIRVKRLKTGTPPRVLSSSINFDEVEKEILDLNNFSFSSRSNFNISQQISCYLTYTNEKTHQIIYENLDKSPMYSRQVIGVGPRYCPSIEDKVVRFRERKRHQIFYEPETKSGDTIYVNGFSTSLPKDVQERALKTLPGMKNAKILKWGYAIEYDAIDSTQLKLSLESKLINGLFFAGQINGTSGYEEAAAQGIIAGINASNYLKDTKPLVIPRDKGYIGVLIDDLVTKGTDEPYRMLTSRAEYRLLLRNDNADERLSEYGYNSNLVTLEEYNKVLEKYQKIEAKEKELKNSFLSANSTLAKKYNIYNGESLYNLIMRPEINSKDVLDFEFLDQIVIRARLAGYIKKQKKQAQNNLKYENVKIPSEIKYYEVPNLSNEAKEKLSILMPETLGQASRISGVNLIDIQMVHFYLSRR